MVDLLAQIAAKKLERENANNPDAHGDNISGVSLVGEQTKQIPAQQTPATPVPPPSTDAFATLTATLGQNNTPAPAQEIPTGIPIQNTSTPAMVNQPENQEAVSIVATDQGNIAVEDIGKFQFSTQPEQASANATEQFRLHLNAMTAALNDDSLPDNIRRTMDFLDANPQMKDILMPDDVQEIVRACRKSYGGAVKKKVKRRTKKTETERQANEMVDMLGADFLMS